MTKIQRRDFIVGSTSMALATVSAGFGCSDDTNQKIDSTPPLDSGSADGKLPPVGAGRVVEVHDPLCISSKTPDAARVKAMLKAGLLALAAQTGIKQAWQALLPGFTPAMRIGIKLNCLSSYLYNSSALVSALVETLVQDLGADSQRILIWDRRGDELQRSKLTGKVMNAKVQGTVKSTSDSSGPGYEPSTVKVKDKTTHLSRILTQETDFIINLPLLKTHGISGATCALKNVYGVIDNPGDFHTNLNTYLPAIYGLSEVTKKFHLHICEALMAVVKGDTADPVDKIPARILLAADPVSMDAHAVALINTLRGTLPPVPASKLQWLDNAAAQSLGTKKIDLKKITL